MDNELLKKTWRSKDDARVGLELVEKIVASECSNGQPLAHYLAQLRSVERSPCTTVWRAGSFAYRCAEIVKKPLLNYFVLCFWKVFSLAEGAILGEGFLRCDHLCLICLVDSLCPILASFFQVLVAHVHRNIA